MELTRPPSSALPRLLAATLLGLTLGLLPTLDAAGDGDPKTRAVTVDRTLPAKARGHVEIRTSAGQVRVIGETRDTVQVTGTVGPGVEAFEVFQDGRYLRFVARPPAVPEEEGPGPRSELTFRVPAGSTVELSTAEAEVRVEGVIGPVRLWNGVGRSTVAGDPRSVHGDSVSGDFEVDVESPEVQLKTVSGALAVRGRIEHLVAETVDRPVRVTAALGVEALLRTVTGEILFTGDPAAEVRLQVESSSGPVILELDGDLEGTFRLESAGGTLENSLGPPWTDQDGRRVARWRHGLSPRRIEVRTFDGDIELRRRPATTAP